MWRSRTPGLFCCVQGSTEDAERNRLNRVIRNAGSLTGRMLGWRGGHFTNSHPWMDNPDRPLPPHAGQTKELVFEKVLGSSGTFPVDVRRPHPCVCAPPLRRVTDELSGLHHVSVGCNSCLHTILRLIVVSNLFLMCLCRGTPPSVCASSSGFCLYFGGDGLVKPSKASVTVLLGCC